MKFTKLTLNSKLLMAFLGASLIPLLIISIFSYSNSQQALESARFNQLRSIAAIKKEEIKRFFTERQGDMQVLVDTVDTLRLNAMGKLVSEREAKKAQIERFFSERFGDINVLADMPFIKTAALDLQQAFNEAGGVSSGEFQGQGKGQYSAPESYTQVHDQYFELFKNYMEQYSYYDIFLMDPINGDIYFTVTKEPDFGIRNSEVASSLRDAWSKARLGQVYLSDMKPYAPSQGLPAQFIAAPIKENNSIKAILAFQISNAAINAIMKERSGFGKTEEAYLVGADYLMRSDSYLDPKNHSVVASFKDPTKGRAETEAIRSALSGKTATDVIIDYNNHPVLSAWSNVKVGAHTWALLVEIDVAEAFSPQDTEGVDFYKKYIKNYGYYDLFLIEPKGKVIYTVTKEADYGTNMVNGKFANSNLGRLVRKSIETKRFGITDFARYAPSNNEPAAFIAQPIARGGKIDLIIALQLSLDAINSIMNQREGMGQTGETYLVGSDYLMRSDSFLDPENHSVKASFANPSLGSVKTEATKRAFSGEDGSGIIIDYNGNPVLSNYSLLDLGDIKWAIISEIDETEAFNFGSMGTLKTVILIMVLGIAGIMAMFGIVFGRSIANPILIISEKLKAAAQQVAAVSNQSSNASQQLAQGATEQASSIEETSASLEEITAMVENNVANSEKSKGVASQMQQSSENGNKKMKELQQSMEEIRDSNHKISGLVKVIGEIGKKTAVIDTIVFQTKLLSFNASVEAERSGEHGRGFAVVAQEVGKLAEMSGKAASEISEILEKSIQDAETITVQNKQKVENGNEFVNQVAEILEDITIKAKNVSDDITQILAASKDQASGIKQINSAVSQLDRATQSSAATAEETASSSEQMSVQASELHHQVLCLRALVKGSVEEDRGLTQDNIRPNALSSANRVPIGAQDNQAIQLAHKKPITPIPDKHSMTPMKMAVGDSTTISPQKNEPKKGTEKETKWQNI